MAYTRLTATLREFRGNIDGLVFYTWQGDTFVRPYKRPRDPKTPRQLDLRGAFARAIRAWRKLTPDEKTRWNRQARKKRTTGYHVFLSAYIRNRWDRAADTRPAVVTMPGIEYRDSKGPLPVHHASPTPAPSLPVPSSFVPPSLDLSDRACAAPGGG